MTCLEQKVQEYGGGLGEVPPTMTRLLDNTLWMMGIRDRQAGSTLGWRGHGPSHSIRQHYKRRNTVGGISIKVTKVKSQVLKVCFWGQREVGAVSF